MNSGEWFEIRVEDHLADGWVEWLGVETIEYSEGETVVTGFVRDQSELYGIIERLRDLGAAIVSIRKTGASG